MRNRLRQASYYGVFFAISLAIHWIFLFPLPWREEPVTPPPQALAQAPDSGVQVEIDAGKQEPPPPPQPNEEEKKKREELEKQIAEKMEQFKQLQMVMEEALKEKDAQLAAQQARQDELERKLAEEKEAREKQQLVKSEDVDEKVAQATEQMKKELDAEKAKNEAEKEELEKRLAETEKKLEERQETDKALAEQQKKEFDKKLAQVEAQAKEREERQKAEAQAKEREMQGRLEQMQRESKAREEALARKVDESKREMDEKLAADRAATAAREREMQKQLAAERAQREALNQKIAENRAAAARETQSAPARTSHKAAAVTSMQEYVEFLRPYLSKEVRKEGVPMPIPGFELDGAGELVDLMNYYQFRLVAYPEAETKRSFFVEVDIDGSGRRSFRKDDDFQKLFNTMVLRLDGIEYFERIKEDLARKQGLDAGAISIAFVTPEDRARYLRWKSIRVCEDNSQSPSDVFQCVGQFRKTKFGAWVFLIDHLVLDSGQLVRVKDFEAEKVFDG